MIAAMQGEATGYFTLTSKVDHRRRAHAAPFRCQ
jgi:hypothetical protein